ncbi:MAG: hypothetical protein GW947_04390 [Candidatus Pacebacteria bacterium]|nr:hypothetical protein [Candidatus Paceibacterota bacterium]PIR59644.1 MAG: hypothetical protein COU68_04515 [Candidatus Pacebacteria bacterium CG10_big_fil_rev_8_21_14_0_10_45_6]
MQLKSAVLWGIAWATAWGSYQLALAPVLAERLESDSYVIQFGNFNVTAGEKSSASYKVTDTVGQTGAGPYGEYGVSSYFIGGGFQYIYQIDQFSFSISKLTIDLGELTTGAHNTDDLTLSITTRGAGGYAVYTYETKPLTHQDGSHTVADTICDSGSCTEAAAGLWTNVNVGGFGFNATGADAASDFLTTDHFRQFADNSTAETMQSIMSSSDIVEDETVVVTYKAGLSTASQAAGRYETATVYVAVPGY